MEPFDVTMDPFEILSFRSDHVQLYEAPRALVLTRYEVGHPTLLQLDRGIRGRRLSRGKVDTHRSCTLWSGCEVELGRVGRVVE